MSVGMRGDGTVQLAEDLTTERLDNAAYHLEAALEEIDLERHPDLADRVVTAVSATEQARQFQTQ